MLAGRNFDGGAGSGAVPDGRRRPSPRCPGWRQRASIHAGVWFSGPRRAAGKRVPTASGRCPGAWLFRIPAMLLEGRAATQSR